MHPTVAFCAQRDACVPLDEALIVGGGQRRKVTSDEGAILLWRWRRTSEKGFVTIAWTSTR
jgi:hypothetical protein